MRRQAHDDVHPPAAAEARMVCAWWDGVRGAYVVRGGPYWWLWAILVEVVVVIRAITMYLRAEKDTDEGALAGSRADERQQLIAQRSWALAGKLTAIAAFVGLTIAIAVRATWWWPFLATRRDRLWLSPRPVELPCRRRGPGG